ncbi:bifunctional glutamate N-acetyltransferase/amino-acid acetyltransferase ArgJ [Pseudactinotalea sp. Z1739]|uniref:bifunctional glutamate N-acetyltransferase/amino-acid acetyltransferase ArgJ n=1 Tax=Pseudactinotalea sp. Z1739 TaxID=3413028 RepID=UPI003C7E9EF2
MTITTPAGFRAAGVRAGLKAQGKDVALVVNDGPHQVGAAVFTRNRVTGWPVQWSREVVADGVISAVVLNSGGANACTPVQGREHTRSTAEHVATHLGLEPEDVVVASTGLIGELLPIQTLLDGVTAAAGELSGTGGDDAAQAIMTTDTVPKSVVVDGEGYTIGGMAKGAGMLAPALATMLCVLTTDAVIDTETARTALARATATTLDRIDSDGCMSTSDTVVLMASGASGRQADAEEFAATLTRACADLSRALIADAEGATKEIAVQVGGAGSEGAAEAVARAVTRSNLVKTAMFGQDPNWGRILAQVGTVPPEVAAFEADRIDVAINGVWVCRDGVAAQDRSEVDLAGREVHIQIELHAGAAGATVWTNDLSHAYIHENSAYST